MQHSDRLQQQLSITPKSIVGTGDPIDGLMLIPLASQWGAQRACHLVQDEHEADCEAMIQRLVIVAKTDPPDEIPANATLAFCEPHFQIIRGGRA